MICQLKPLAVHGDNEYGVVWPARAQVVAEDADDMILWPPAELTLPYECVDGVFPAAQLGWSVERLRQMPVNVRTQNHGAQYQDQWIERRPRVVEVDSEGVEMQ
jgi:hypothetical protein